ncbi:sporulation protein [Pulveribacter suum]|uniref:Sporulation protein n=1 Tax=Pulveribacter suum TaxID=2116657 RepID=A0A2P1NHG9_9BURK|nr:sporulation protein [Pulveribacter suum]AVP56430.1 sporulation protein [Pulveribacter suum]
MLRLAVLVLLLANAGYYAWSAGLLQDWGLGPVSDGEPQRLQQQVEPQKLRLLAPQTGASAAAPAPPPAAAPPASAAAPAAPAPDAPASAAAAAASAAAAAPPPGICLQAGVFDARQGDALRSALAEWPEGSWQLESTPVAGRWMVYMGRFPDEEIVARKRLELRALKIPYDRPGQALEPGLSLGRFSTEEAAQRGLGQLASQGVRTARVVQERADAPGYTLRLPAVSPALRPRMAALEPALAGRALKPCG